MYRSTHLNLTEKTNYSFGSTHVDFDSQYLQRLHEPWHLIKDDELAEEGIETDTHCTVRYGIESCDYFELYKAIQNFEPPFKLKIIDIDMFETKDGDCILWKVEPVDWLLKMRTTVETVADCAPPSFPDYKPHITIAYVKQGLGRTIIERIKQTIPNVQFEIEADNLILAEKSGKRHVIPLSNVSSKTLAEMSLQAMYQIDEGIHNVKITIPLDKLSGWKAKQFSEKVEKVGGKYTQGKKEHIFKMPAKYGKTAFHKLWNSKGMKEDEKGPRVRYF